MHYALIYCVCMTDSDWVKVQDVMNVTQGTRVMVYWDGEGEWYEGECIGVDSADGTIGVLYDDGDTFWNDCSMDVMVYMGDC